MKSFKLYLLEADYSRFLKKNKNLTDDQRKEINTFFSKTNTQAGSKIGSEIGWQSKKIKTMSYDAFLDIMIKYRSGRKAVLKAPRMKGKKNEDYIQLKIKNKDFLAYIPLNYETAQFMNTKKFGACAGDWCIGSTMSDYHWNDEVLRIKQVPVYVISTEGKWVAMIQVSNNTIDVYSTDNDPSDVDQDIPGMDVRKELLTPSLKKLYNEVRVIQRENTLFPKWLRDAKYKDEIIDVDDSGQVGWHNGVWIDGTAHFYTWDTGLWKKGIWMGGKWSNGLWESGTWHRGYWMDGVWKKGLWEGGVWYDGVWEGGTWKLGNWEGGTWKGGTWEKGVWKGGYDKDGTFHKVAPNMWGGEEDQINKWSEYFQLVSKQQGMEAELFEIQGKEMNILTGLANAGRLVPDMRRMIVEVANESHIRISGAIIKFPKKDPFFKKKFSVTFKESIIEEMYLTKDSHYFLDGCSINYIEVKFDTGGVMRDCIIYGGMFDTTELGNYASVLSSYGVIVNGGVWENKANHRRPIECTSFKECSLKNYVPEGKMFTNVLFENCLIDIDKIDNMKNCQLLECEITDREAIKNYRNITIID